MANVLLLGNGFVAGPCLEQLVKSGNRVTVASRDKVHSQRLLRTNVTAISLNVMDHDALVTVFAQHDIVISLIPYTLHARVIRAAIVAKRNVVTTSYVSPEMQSLDQQCKDAGITVFNEIGVDPGIDHLYAIKTIDEVHRANGKIIDFLSYCGGLPAPECSNNPLGYKFSWSSRGVLLALRNDAKYWENGVIRETPGKLLMDIAKPIHIYPAFAFEGYPNRDSSPYTERYNIPECKNLIRGTLRYQGFPKFVKALVVLGFLNDAPLAHLAESSPAITWSAVLAKAIDIETTDEQELAKHVLSKTGLSGEEGQRILAGLRWLGMFSQTNVHLRGNLLDTLCATLEEKMQYENDERDMVMLQHKFRIQWANGQFETRTSTGLWFGVPGGNSAMATTVGVPCAIAVQLILDGRITKKGVLAPMTMEFVTPLIEELEKAGIRMVEHIL